MGFTNSICGCQNEQCVTMRHLLEDFLCVFFCVCVQRHALALRTILKHGAVI